MSAPKCEAKLRQGDGTCAKPAGWGTEHKGLGRCRLHGGNTANHVAHARRLREEAWQRILEMTDPALAELRRLIDEAESEAVKLAAVRDVLDRAGLGARHVHEISGPAGGPIPVEVRAAELLERAKALQPPPAKKARKRAAKT